jgi:putative transposase
VEIDLRTCSGSMTPIAADFIQIQSIVHEVSEHEINTSKRNNQNFVFVPHARFIDMLTYKAELVGIRVIVTEESYTSKASFLDLDELPIYGPGGDREQLCWEARGARIVPVGK